MRGAYDVVMFGRFRSISQMRILALRAILGVAIIVALCGLWLSNTFLTERFTQSTRNGAEVRLTLYAGNLYSELQRNATVPQLLARDPELISALRDQSFQSSTQRLISFLDEIGAKSLSLMDHNGRTVAATNRTELGENHKNSPYFINAQRASATTFTIERSPSGSATFFYSRKLEAGGAFLGVIAVEIDLRRIEAAWARTADEVFVSDSQGNIILATIPAWRGKDEPTALGPETPRTGINRAIDVAQGFGANAANTYMQGLAVMRMERRVAFQGWRMVSFTPYASVRERVNAALALEVMGFAVLIIILLYYLNYRARTKAFAAERESASLRILNQRLQTEIAERERVERTLEVAEQTIEQSSKLAALGEMSAAVSHELNQPLAAMKTYLAGARLLLDRRRPEEAISAIQRIDDLIDRMGAITRQLKSYARKGAEGWAPIDMREAVNAALALMEPQLKARDVAISRTLPDHPVIVRVDRMRLEQVIINLLRNALDATKGITRPRVEISLIQSSHARLSVRDNGHGIADLDALFEPFYTTKRAGDGIGLGLAISSGIVSDFGGRLTARHGLSAEEVAAHMNTSQTLAQDALNRGAIFEVELPIYDEDMADKP